MVEKAFSNLNVKKFGSYDPSREGAYEMGNLS